MSKNTFKNLTLSYLAKLLCLFIVYCALSIVKADIITDPLRTFSGHINDVVAVAFFPDGQYAVSGSDDGTVKLWNVNTGREIRTFQDFSTSPSGDAHSIVRSIAFSPDEQYLLWGGVGEPSMTMWNVNTGETVRTFSGHTADTPAVAFSPDGQYALSGSYDNTMKLWNVNTGAEIRTFTGHSDDVRSVAFSPDGQTALSGSDDYTLKLWNVNTGIEIRIFSGHSSIVNSVAISQDGQYVLSGSSDNTLKLWNMNTGMEIRTFSRQSSSVFSVAFSPNGQYALSGSVTGIKLWNVNTGTEIRAFYGHNNWVISTAFSPDGQYALSGSSDHTVKLWETGLISQAPPTYTFSVTASPPSSGSIELNPNQNEYNEGETVTVTANPASGYQFDNWSGDCSGSSLFVTLAMNTNKSCTANFAQAATDCNAVSGISTIECQSLLELYNSTDGSNWKNNEGWNLTNTPCSWYGVTCENGGVTKIVLDDNQLIGTISNFSALPNLQSLALNFNQLTGIIPNFNALPKLQQLYIDDNQLTGAIPDFSALTKLEYLDLRNNPICKDANITYSSWPIKRAKESYGKDEVEVTWQEELDTFPNCAIVEDNESEDNSDAITAKMTAGIGGGEITVDDVPVDGTTVFPPPPVTVEPPPITNTDDTNTLGQAIIIAAGGAQPDNTLFVYSNDFTQRMYRLLIERGFSDTDIHYLNPWQPDIDLDGYPDNNRQDYNLFDPKPELSAAFTQAAANLSAGQQFVFYLHGHARPDHFLITPSYELSATHLRDLLATLPTGVQQIIILDSCYSGSFADELAGVANRVIITSADDNTLAWNTQFTSFADKFLRSLRRGDTIHQAFLNAEDMIVGDPKLFRQQRPWLDDDTDGQYTTRDGTQAAQIYLGKEGIHAAPPPKITSIHDRIELGENATSATLWVRTTPTQEGIRKVQAVLINPNFASNDYQGKATDFGRDEVELIYNQAQTRHEIAYDGFWTAGPWRILYQAQGTDGAWSDIVSGEVQVPNIGCNPCVKMVLNQSRYTAGEQLRLDMEVNGNVVLDLYVAVVFPDGMFMTIAYPLNFSWPNAIQAYKTNITVSGETRYPVIVDFPLPTSVAPGGHKACGVLIGAGNDLDNQSNWLHIHCADFEVY